jgi:hypothetical protein
MPAVRRAPRKEKATDPLCEEREDGASAFAKATADEPAFAKATADEPAKPKSGKATDPPLQGTQGWGTRKTKAGKPKSERQRLQNLRSWGVSGIDGLGERS